MKKMMTIFALLIFTSLSGLSFADRNNDKNIKFYGSDVKSSKDSEQNKNSVAPSKSEMDKKSVVPVSATPSLENS